MSQSAKPTFEDLIAEAAAAPVEGWDFSWLEGRATEERPSWGYARLAARRMKNSRRALDIQTGGGEVLTGLGPLPPLTAATEAWPPNLRIAAGRLAPLGVQLVAAASDRPGLPFRDQSFDLVISRHPVVTWWQEIARVLRPRGTFLSQQVGAWNVKELIQRFRGQSYRTSDRTLPNERIHAERAGLVVVDAREETLRTVFFDIGAVVYFLRKVVWNVPDFSVERYRSQLAALHQEIEDRGSFVTHARRFLIEARKPAN
jgi:SAM-dependent methyltransferase